MDLASITSHIHNWVLFLLWLHPFILLELFLHWSPVAYWAPTDPGSSPSVSYHFAFSYCSWGSQGKNTEVVCHSLLQWTSFCQTSPPWPSHLGWPHKAWLSFIELDKAVVYVIRLASFLWLRFQCVCPLMPSHNTYHLIGFLLPWAWGTSSWWRQQSAATPPYLGLGVSPHGRPSWPWMWNSSSWPFCARTAATLLSINRFAVTTGINYAVCGKWGYIVMLGMRRKKTHVEKG